MLPSLGGSTESLYIAIIDELLVIGTASAFVRFCCERVSNPGMGQHLLVNCTKLWPIPGLLGLYAALLDQS